MSADVSHLPYILISSSRDARKILTQPSNSSLMVTQPHLLLATRMTWMTQIACLAGLYSHTVLHCTYLVLVPYKDVSCVHFDGAHATRAHAGLG